MVNSSFQTENLEQFSPDQDGQSLDNTLLNIFRQTRHQVLAIFVQCLALFGIFVGWVNDRDVLDGLWRPFRGL